jgi:hypothetical protein
MFATGQGQQPKLHSHSKVWAEVRELPNAWDHMETDNHSWHRQFQNSVLDSAKCHTLLPPGRKSDANIPYFQWVGHILLIVEPVAHCIL